MNTNTRLALFLGTAVLLTFAALAQTVPAGEAGAPPPPRIHSAGGIEYINGGAGEESRAAIDAERQEFPLRLVFSVASGAYVVADHVDVNDKTGRILGVDNAGPMLLVKVPPGDYTVDASYGGRTEQRRIHVGRDAGTVNWRWPEEARR
ncbi:MAG TPA: hypothetical protein VH041_08870 [Caldimonas sp.]|jgi:hypothetical protein|nr:hypothetical protein [Caldimonas sp.]HEX4234408.1 hypothetical protein [Caldimonas sp.]